MGQLIAVLGVYGRRSREGAWIEIAGSEGDPIDLASRSREGAWIEM